MSYFYVTCEDAKAQSAGKNTNARKEKSEYLWQCVFMVQHEGGILVKHPWSKSKWKNLGKRQKYRTAITLKSSRRGNWCGQSRRWRGSACQTAETSWPLQEPLALCRCMTDPWGSRQHRRTQQSSRRHYTTGKKEHAIEPMWHTDTVTKNWMRYKQALQFYSLRNKKTRLSPQRYPTYEYM